jgi:hypothetical protein
MTWGADNATVTVLAGINTTAAAAALFNNNNTLIGTSNGTISAGVLPSTIGTISALGQLVPMVKLEP